VVRQYIVGIVVEEAAHLMAVRKTNREKGRCRDPNIILKA
jgi:hypothetical protein